MGQGCAPSPAHPYVLRYNAAVRKLDPSEVYTQRRTCRMTNAPGHGLVKSVPVNEIANPLSDDEKHKRGKQWIDVNGNPKSSHHPLTPTDEILIVQFERYNTHHDCDLCGNADKSPKVVLCRNMFTGEEFRAAGSCLLIHFGLKIANYEKQSEVFVTTVEGFAAAVGAEDDNLGSTADALKAILSRVDTLHTIACPANDEVKEALENLGRQEAQGAAGKHNQLLQKLQSYLLLQTDFAKQPHVFKDRWHAIWHLIRRQGKDLELLALLSRAAEHPQKLTLDDFHDLHSKALPKLQQYKVNLRNEGLLPWDYPTRDAYLQGLQEYYSVRASMRSAKPRFWIKESRELGERALRHTEKKRVFEFSVLSPYMVKSPLEKFIMPNLDTIKARGGLIASAPDIDTVFTDSGSEGIHIRGFTMYFPDPWNPMFSIWHAHGGSKGRKRLETIDRSLLLKAKAADAVSSKPPRRKAKSAKNNDAGGAQRPRQQGNPNDFKSNAIHYPVASSMHAVSPADIQAKQQELLADIATARGKPLTRRQLQKLESFAKSAAYAILGRPQTLNVSAIRLLQQEVANLEDDNEFDFVASQDEPVRDFRDTESILPQPQVATETPATTPSKDAPPSTPKRHKPIQRKTLRLQSFLPEPDYVIEGSPSLVQTAVETARKAGLQPQIVRGGRPGQQWKAHLCIETNHDFSRVALERTGWKLSR